MDKHNDAGACKKCGGPLKFHAGSQPVLKKEGDMDFATGQGKNKTYCPNCDKNEERPHGLL